MAYEPRSKLHRALAHGPKVVRAVKGLRTAIYAVGAGQHGTKTDIEDLESRIGVLEQRQSEADGRFAGIEQAIEALNAGIGQISGDDRFAAFRRDIDEITARINNLDIRQIDGATRLAAFLNGLLETIRRSTDKPEGILKEFVDQLQTGLSRLTSFESGRTGRRPPKPTGRKSK